MGAIHLWRFSQLTPVPGTASSLQLLHGCSNKDARLLINGDAWLLINKDAWLLLKMRGCAGPELLSLFL